MKVGEMVEVGKLPVGATFGYLSARFSVADLAADSSAAGFREQLPSQVMASVGAIAREVKTGQLGWWPKGTNVSLLSLPSEDKPSFPRKPKSFEEIKVGMRVRTDEAYGEEATVGCVHPQEGQLYLRGFADGRNFGVECNEHGTSWVVYGLAGLEILSDPAPGVPASGAEADRCKKCEGLERGAWCPYCDPDVRAVSSPGEAPYALQPRTEAQESVSRVLASWSGLEDFPELPTEDDVEHSRWQRRTAAVDAACFVDHPLRGTTSHDRDANGGVSLGPLDQRIAACGGSLDPKPERMTLRSRERGLQP